MTRRTIVFYQCDLAFFKICITFALCNHMQQFIFVFAGFLKNRFLFRVIKLFKNSTFPFPNSASFVVTERIFLFVYMRDNNKFWDKI